MKKEYIKFKNTIGIEWGSERGNIYIKYLGNKFQVTEIGDETQICADKYTLNTIPEKPCSNSRDKNVIFNINEDDHKELYKMYRYSKNHTKKPLIVTDSFKMYADLLDV